MKKEYINLEISNIKTAEALILVIESHLKRSLNKNDWNYIKSEFLRMAKVTDVYKESLQQQQQPKQLNK